MDLNLMYLIQNMSFFQYFIFIIQLDLKIIVFQSIHLFSFMDKITDYVLITVVFVSISFLLGLFLLMVTMFVYLNL
jgi:hypothetical protein